MPQSGSQTQLARQAHRDSQLGQAHASARRWPAAGQAFGRAARLQPHDAVYALNHARALHAQGHELEAGLEARRSFELNPGQLAARDFAVDCLQRAQRHADVVEMLRSVGPSSECDWAHHTLLGNALLHLQRTTEAVSALLDAVARRPEHAPLHYNLGQAFADLNLNQEAAQCYGTALLLGMGKFELSALGKACLSARMACAWGEAETDLDRLHAAASALQAESHVPTAPFAHAVLGDDRAAQLLVARSLSNFLAQDVRPLPAVRSDWQPGARMLRIGYVSCDFHAHATAMLMAEMLEHHDHSKVEISLYSHGAPDGSPMRDRLEAACHRFIDVRSLSDQQVAERIRADGIDLLVDLKGHTRDNRLRVFAYRPAPVQASFLGFPGSTGAGFIDYLIGDPVVTPLEHAADYSEKLAQMPACYQPNDRLRSLGEAPTRASQGLPAEALVLCSFNHPYKISPAVFDSWCRLLQKLPQAVLWLLESSPQALANLRAEATRRGVDPARLVGAQWLPAAPHLARLQLADLFLDTWPCNAHTTASDALWAGVPVITVLGETFAARVCASLLQAVGLLELVSRDVADYEATVIDLAADAARRQSLRDRLIDARQQSPLFNAARSARDIEALYFRMALRHAEHLPPEHLPSQH